MQTDHVRPADRGGLPAAQLAALGGFFALDPGVPPPGDDWTPVDLLLADDQAIAGLVDATALRLGTDDRAVAASVTQFGWAARLVSIWAGCLELVGWAPDLGPELVVRRVPTGGGPAELGLTDVRQLDAAAAWSRLVDDHLGGLAAALGRHVRLGKRLLAGNIASSLAGAFGAIERHGTTTIPDLLERPWAAPADLAGLGDWAGDPPRFRRTTCCGYDRVPGAERCGDCSLDRPRTPTR